MTTVRGKERETLSFLKRELKEFNGRVFSVRLDEYTGNKNNTSSILNRLLKKGFIEIQKNNGKRNVGYREIKINSEIIDFIN